MRCLRMWRNPRFVWRKPKAKKCNSEALEARFLAVDSLKPEVLEAIESLLACFLSPQAGERSCATDKSLPDI